MLSIATPAPADAARADTGAAAPSLFARCVRVPLPELGVIRVEGPDAAAFLHAQLTNDMLNLPGNVMRQAGYCNVKGRLIATLHVWRSGEDIDLLLPREILPAVLKRLSMFVLRAKARLTDASDRFEIAALLGPDAGERVRGWLGDAPAMPWALAQADGVHVVRLPDSPQCPDRWLLLWSAGAAPPWSDEWTQIATEEPARFWWTQIDAALPTVFSATQEKFVPQMINFELVGGVNFRKGCFPGQEVVARSQYLGKLRRRMSLAHTDATDASVAPGADVFAPGEGQAIGTIVMSAPGPRGGTDLLFECPVERADGDLRVGGAQGSALQLRPLPYPIVDVTA